MISHKRMEHYRTYMRHYALVLSDFSEMDLYIAKLIYQDNLSPLEEHLREWIEQCPPDE